MSDKKSILDTSISTEDYETFITEAMSYITGVNDLTDLMKLSLEEGERRKQVNGNISSSPAFLKYIDSLQDALKHMLMLSGTAYKDGIMVAGIDELMESLMHAAVQLFMTGIRVGRMLENPSQVDDLDVKLIEAKARIEAFAKEDEKEETASPGESKGNKSKSSLGEIGFATDRKMNIQH